MDYNYKIKIHRLYNFRDLDTVKKGYNIPKNEVFKYFETEDNFDFKFFGILYDHEGNFKRFIENQQQLADVVENLTSNNMWFKLQYPLELSMLFDTFSFIKYGTKEIAIDNPTFKIFHPTYE
jgi:hypothetical protein